MDTETENRTYVESSRDGAVMLELDKDGHTLRVELEPEVNATWTADILGERLVRLHTLALMRARCDQLARMNERGANMRPDDLYSSEAEVAAYRANYIDF